MLNLPPFTLTNTQNLNKNRWVFLCLRAISDFIKSFHSNKQTFTFRNLDYPLKMSMFFNSTFTNTH